MLNLKSMSFAAPAPYPPIKVSEKNLQSARWMLDNMGGSNSEMSSVSLYLYNNFITSGDRQEVSFIFQKTSIVEMHHLHIFGELAMCLGENPRLWTQRSNRKVYWTPAYNNYTVQFDDLMHQALNGELAAIQKYETQIKYIADCNITDILKRIILDEKLHVEILQQIMTEYNISF